MAVWPLCLSFFLLFALDASEATLLTGTSGEAEPPEDTSDETCESGSGWSAYNGRCFRFFNFLHSWIDAEKQCLGYDGNLASVHSYEEYTFIQDLVKSQTHASTTTWLGGYDAVKEGTWLWSDGSKLNLEIWAPGEPNNYNRNENCIVMNYQSLSNWNDYSCDVEKPFVCVKKWRNLTLHHLLIDGDSPQ
uniref:C-type lectin domain-containing protein n=1 Tax=Cyprinus carpio carpio TaxID=630221 RepID=A0A9J7ZCG1_CYPCA